MNTRRKLTGVVVKNKMDKIKLLIVDDHTVVRQGLRGFFVEG